MRPALVGGQLDGSIDVRRALVVLDYDGTLARLVPRPSEARVDARTWNALAGLARRTPVAVLSGRARADLLPRLSALPLRHVIGCHGAEWSRPIVPPGSRRRVRQAAAMLREAFAGVPGVVVEDKGLALAVHVRHAEAPEAAVRRARALLADTGLDLSPGKLVVNAGVHGFDKAAAIARLAERYPGRPVVFVGDDDNDERAFAARLPGMIGVRVGPVERTAADWGVPDQAAVAPLLAAISARLG